MKRLRNYGSVQRRTRWIEIPQSQIPLELKHRLSIIRDSNGSLYREAIWNKVRQIAESLAAPATVCGEQMLAEATGKLGRQSTSIDPQARKPAIASVTHPPNGVFWWSGYPFSVARQFVLTAKGHRNMGLPSNFIAAKPLNQLTGFEVNVRTESILLPFCDQSSAITERRSNALSISLFFIEIRQNTSWANCRPVPGVNFSFNLSPRRNV